MCDRFWENGNVASRETRGNGEIHRGNSAYSFEGLRWCKDSIRAIALLLSQSVREYFQEYRNRFVWQVCVCTLVFIRIDILAYLSQNGYGKE